MLGRCAMLSAPLLLSGDYWWLSRDVLQRLGFYESLDDFGRSLFSIWMFALTKTLLQGNGVVNDSPYHGYHTWLELWKSANAWRWIGRLIPREIQKQLCV